MPIEKWSDSVAVVHLADDPQFSEELEAAAKLGPPCLNRVLDFSAVHFVNSSNVAALLTLRNQIQRQNGKLVLCNLANQILSTFLVTGLDKIFQISEDVPTALATIQMDGRGN
ncbi:MAG: STAS domain-containing protein [Tepidisphaeraceae bacterium]|jgi:anti-anti-sigma factor